MKRINKSYVHVIRYFACVILLAYSQYPSLAANQKRINIDITTHLGDINRFQAGDKVSFLLSLDTAAHILVIYQDAGGNIIQILPNRNLTNSFFKAGLFISLPEPGAGYAFQIQPPYGKEVLRVFASDSPLPEFKGRYLADGLKKLEQGVKTIRNGIVTHSRTAYGEARLILHTRARE